MYLSLCNKRTDSGELEELFLTCPHVFKQKGGKNRRRNHKNHTPLQSKSLIKRGIFYVHKSTTKSHNNFPFELFFDKRRGFFSLSSTVGIFTVLCFCIPASRLCAFKSSSHNFTWPTQLQRRAKTQLQAAPNILGSCSTHILIVILLSNVFEVSHPN